MKRRDTLTALGFLAALALALAVVVSSCFGGEGALETLLKQALRDRDVQAVLDGAERAVNQDLDRDHFFIQLFGGVQRLSGRRVVEDAVGENTVVKLSTGALNFVDLTGPDPAPQAAENAGLRRPSPRTCRSGASPTVSCWPPRRSAGIRRFCPQG